MIEWPRPTSCSFQRLDETNDILAERIGGTVPMDARMER
jgi:hypothetical protein